MINSSAECPARLQLARFKLPESTWSGVVMDESRWVLGRDSLFMRKNKATHKKGAKGVCMLWVVGVISGVEEIAGSFIP